MSTSSCSVSWHQGGLLVKKGILIKLFAPKDSEAFQRRRRNQPQGQVHTELGFLKGIQLEHRVGVHLLAQ